ncbi:hypothetical protein [uncultured Roseobacter sp.]|uniref:hypothetical protein n=1 Tax=uncultured Roseobacter sp. TaxID=114847 RepID=UPI00261BC15A|nr:hypothetical protein [uncultured Roseobacter sp.]
MPNYFRPIEIPEYCFLSEAVEWLAIGEVPEAEWEIPEQASQSDTYPTEVEYRFAWEFMPGNFQPQSELAWFDRDILSSLEFPFDAGTQRRQKFVRLIIWNGAKNRSISCGRRHP